MEAVNDEEAEFRALLRQLLPGLDEPMEHPATQSRFAALPAAAEPASSEAAASLDGFLAPTVLGTPLANPHQRATLLATLRCPLSGALLADPIVLTDGLSYDRAAAEAALGPAVLAYGRPNVALRQLVEELSELGFPA